MCLLLEMRDGVQVLEVRPPGRSGGSSNVRSCGQIRVMESRRKVEGQEMETSFWRE